jgi:carbon storage regulator
MIGDDIEIVILELRGDRISVGIQAPADVKVHRLEVWKRIQVEKARGQVPRGRLRERGGAA